MTKIAKRDSSAPTWEDCSGRCRQVSRGGFVPAAKASTQGALLKTLFPIRQAFNAPDRHLVIGIFRLPAIRPAANWQIFSTSFIVAGADNEF
ncbi:MAG TPA: hypothetical protein VGG30_10985 [Pirellulales bacterium]